MRITRRSLLAGVAIATSAAVLTACAPSSGADGSTSAGTGKKTTLSLVAYSVPKAADGALEKAFAKTDPGTGVTWKQSYGASGDQSRAVVGGLKADVVHFSLAPDVTRLVDEGLVDKAWNQDANKGILSTSVVVDRRPQGQPQEHRVVRRPGQARRRHRDPQPGLVGLGPLEHPRGVPVTSSPTVAARLTPRRTSRSCSPTSRRCPAAVATRRPRSRAAPATSCCRTRTRRSSPGRAARTSTTSCPSRTC